MTTGLRSHLDERPVAGHPSDLDSFRERLETYGDLRATFLTLARLVTSHFGYEEAELEDPIGQ